MWSDRRPSSRNRWPLPAVLMLLLLATLARADEAPPNVVVILLDDVGAGSLSLTGNKRVETPRLDRLASKGIRFERFYTNAPNCSPMRAAFLTGRYPHRFNISDVIAKESARGLPAGVPTLPSVLRDAGYRTMHVGKWHLGQARTGYRPAAHGFEEYALFRKDLRSTHRDAFLEYQDGTVEQVSGHLTEVLTDLSIEFVDRMKAEGKPFFLSLWHYAAHTPLLNPSRIAKRYPATKTGRYYAMIAHADEQIGRLLDRLESNGQADNTIVLALGDNGAVETMRGANGGLSGGKRLLREGGIRSFFLLRWPAHLSPNRVERAPVFSTDLLPTLAAWAGADVSGLEFDGVDRSNEWETNGPATERSPVFFHRTLSAGRRGDSWAVFDGPWKLLSERGRLRLFDEAGLMREARRDDRSDLHPELVAELCRKFDDWRVRSTGIPLVVSRVEGSVTPNGPAGHQFVAPGGLVGMKEQVLLDFSDGHFTFTARVRPDRLQPEQVLAARTGCWELRLEEGGRPVLRLSGPGGRKPVTLRAKASRVLTEDTWHRVTWTVRSTRDNRAILELFVDGILAAKTKRSGFSVPVTDTPLVLGSREDGSGSYYGSIDDVRCFVAPLTPEQQTRLED